MTKQASRQADCDREPQPTQRAVPARYKRIKNGDHASPSATMR